MSRVLAFRQPASPALADATALQRLWWRVLDAPYALHRLLRLPSSIRAATIEDAVSGHAIRIDCGPRFTCISIDGRDFYFHRITGRFDGTGCAASPQHETERTR